MYKLCKTQESAQRQRQLELGLLAAMKQQRYEEISISELCLRMQIPRKTFYRYFDSKDGALFGLIDHTLMEYEGYVFDYINGSKRSLERELEQFFRFWLDQRDLLDVLHNSGLGGILMERAIGFALTDAVMPRRFLPEDSAADQAQVTMFGVCGLLSMVLAWHLEGFRQSPVDLARVAARILSKPLFPMADELL